MGWFLLPPQGLWSPDEGSKLLQLKNLRWESSHLAHDIEYPGRTLDPNLHFAQSNTNADLLRSRGNRLYFQRLPIFPLFNLPLFYWFGIYGLYILPALGGSLIVGLTVKWVKPASRLPVALLLIALGSPVTIYATIFWEHTLATGFSLAAAGFALSLGSGRRWGRTGTLMGWGITAVGMGLGFYLRQETILFALAFLATCWLLIPEQRMEILGGAAFLGLLLIPYPILHQALLDGQAFPDNARYLFYPLLYLKSASWRAIPDFLIGPSFDLAMSSSWLDCLWAAVAVGALVLSFVFTDSRLARGLKWICLGISSTVAMAFLVSSIPYRSAHGLLFTTPWALLGLCRVRDIWQQGNRQARIIALTTVLGVVAYAIAILGFRASNPHGGLEWGARFFMTFYPLLAILTVGDWGAEKGKSVRRSLAAEFDIGILIVLILLGIGFQARGLWTIRYDKQVNAALNRTIAESPLQYVVSDLWWLPYNTATITNPRAIFVAPTPSRLADWLSKAVDQNVKQFLLITLDGDFLNQTNKVLQSRTLCVVETQRVAIFLIQQVGINQQ